MDSGKISASSAGSAGLESPRDRYWTTYALFFLLGLVHYLPWSFFSTATDFWMYKFRNTSIETTDSELRTELQAQFNASLKITINISSIVALLLTLMFGHYITIRNRMLILLSVISVLFGLVTSFVKINTDAWQEVFFGMVMVISTGVNAMNGVFTATVYALMSFFPHVYVTAYLLGGGLSGIFTSTLQILSLSLGLSTEDSALVYFSVGFSVLVFTLVFMALTDRIGFYAHYANKEFKGDRRENVITWRESWRLLRKIWSVELTIIFVLLTIDASPTALVVSEYEGAGPWNDVYFIPTITYFLATVVGQTGRVLSVVFIPKLTSTGWCLFSFVAMLLFVPLFIFCNAQPRHHLPVLFSHDYQYIIITICFNLISGYLLSLTIYSIANLVEPDELKKAYDVNVLCLGLVQTILSFTAVLTVELL